MKIIRKKQLEIYVTSSGKKPFITWFESLRDKTIRYRIEERLDRLALGNLGDFKSISDGVFELRLTFGSGYRIYWGQVDEKIILLLCAGD